MIETQIQVRVRYAETDKMGYVYYGNYATYFEVARVELLRKYGLNYKDLEDQGIILPVLDYQCRYYKPAFYDDLLTVKVRIPKLPGVRVVFEYETFNEAQQKINEALTTLVFINSNTNKPQTAPSAFIQTIESAFS